MEIIRPFDHDKYHIKAVIFDFDGTLSTIRYGWVPMMYRFFMKYITDGRPVSEAQKAELNHYTLISGGIQTVVQMMWFVDRIKEYGLNPNANLDPWFYKTEFLAELNDMAHKNRNQIFSGERPASDFLIKGSVEFLTRLQAAGLKTYIASGTEEPDLRCEAEALGLLPHLTKIYGSPLKVIRNAKEHCLQCVMEEEGFDQTEILFVGDGHLEISIGHNHGTLTLGAATDENTREDLDPVKRKVLIEAGADAIVPNYVNSDEIFDWLCIKD